MIFNEVTGVSEIFVYQMHFYFYSSLFFSIFAHSIFLYEVQDTIIVERIGNSGLRPAPCQLLPKCLPEERESLANGLVWHCKESYYTHLQCIMERLLYHGQAARQWQGVGHLFRQS